MKSSEPEVATEKFFVEGLGDLNLAGDGTRMFLSLIGEGDRKFELDLPTDCLKALILTLPQVMKQALRRRYRDDTLRLVYPAQTIRIEQSSDHRTLIVTFTTSDGFEVSLGLTDQQLTCLSSAAAERGSSGADGIPIRFS